MQSHGVLTSLARPRALVQRTQFTCNLPCQTPDRGQHSCRGVGSHGDSRFLARSILEEMDREGIDFESRTKD